MTRPAEVLHVEDQNGTPVAARKPAAQKAHGGSAAAYPDDFIELPSLSRPGRVHRVALNVLTNAVAGCSCEAGQKGKLCWAAKEISTEECSYPLQRCAEPGCGAILRLGRLWTGSGDCQRIFVCATSGDHSRREAASARLFRSEALAELYAEVTAR